MVDRFIARFGQDQIAVIHSKLSIGERFDAWNKIVQGKVKIVIGARSAIFAPIKAYSDGYIKRDSTVFALSSAVFAR